MNIGTITLLHHDGISLSSNTFESTRLLMRSTSVHAKGECSVLALANADSWCFFFSGKWLAVAFHWLGVARGGFSVARSGSRWLFVAFLGPGVARRFFFFFFVASPQTTCTTRALNVLRWCSTPTTVFILPVLLLLEFCFYQTTHDLSLGLNCLHRIQNCTAATTHGCRDCQSCIGGDFRRSSARLRLGHLFHQPL